MINKLNNQMNNKWNNQMKKKLYICGVAERWANL